jgi:hypothetical protein
MKKIKWSVLILFLVGLCFALPPADIEITEAWRGLHAGPAGRVAWGDRHVHLNPGTASEVRVGLPAGVLGVFDGRGDTWVVLKNGALRSLKAPVNLWQGMSEALDFSVDAKLDSLAERGLWIFGSNRLLHLRMDKTQAHVQSQFFITAKRAEFRRDELALFLRLDDALYSLENDQPRYLGDFPTGSQEWGVHTGRAIYLNHAGDLKFIMQELALENQCLPSGEWMRLAALNDQLILQDEKGELFRWKDGQLVYLGWPGLGSRETWIATEDGGLLIESERRREFWHKDQHWNLEANWSRQPFILDQHFRYTGHWQLEQNGEVTLDDASVGHFEDGQHFSFAGAGPLLLCESELHAFDSGGVLLASQSLDEMRASLAVDDHLLLAQADSVSVYWTGDSQPLWLQSLPLSGTESLTWQGRWSLAKCGERLQQIDLLNPWQPLLADNIAFPLDACEMQVKEDHLFVAHPEGLLCFNLSAGLIESVEAEIALPECEWLCLRGANRLLALSARGVLSQMRLAWGLPIEMEWQDEIAITGRMQIFQDSLRVTGAAGTLSVPLPSLAFFTAVEEPHALQGQSDAKEHQKKSRSHEVDFDLHAQATGLDFRSHGDLQSLDIRLYDLLGRELANWQFRKQNAAHLSMHGLATGTYFLLMEAIELDGRKVSQSRSITWCP